MKRVVFALTTAGLVAAGSVAAAQSIAPECAASAASAGMEQGYDIAFDAERGVCVAAVSGADAVVSSQAEVAAAGALGGIGATGAIIVGVATLTFIGVSSTGGT